MAAIRINAGGQAYTDSIGNLWLADQYFNGGNIYSTTYAIANKVEYGTLANTQVVIGGNTAILTEVSSQRIKGMLPSFANTNTIDLLDVNVNSNG
ncbi:hypothetical protein HCG51_02425 [Tolypothrix sp. PCC 7910]|uniref:hypothetical protein n=1 Tax=Tolypothrix sp. PCC 7910 TaxID=2099387 RepID=UPI0014279EE5|nr:hypothetical protein [Tolypothrix sp. PCC 7910]QIR35718.1 hypothetical protein HCG51_02425 [Tolypothrix sp. PCC 7910]